MPVLSSTSATQLPTTTITIQQTLEVLPESLLSTDFTYSVPAGEFGPSISTMSDMVAVYTTIWAIDILKLPSHSTDVSQLPTTTITVKATVTEPPAIFPTSDYSYWFPAGDFGPSISTFSNVVAVYTTIFAIAFEPAPHTSKDTTSTSSKTTTTSWTGGGVCDPSPCEPAPTNGTVATTTASALCFDEVLQRDLPCPTTATPADYTPSGASTVGLSGAAGILKGSACTAGAFALVWMVFEALGGVLGRLVDAAVAFGETLEG